MEEVKPYLYSFLTSTLDRGDGQFHAFSTLIPAKESLGPLKRGWVDHGAVLGGLEKKEKNLHLPKFKHRILRSSSL